MVKIIIDGDACPVVQSIIDLTLGTSIFVTIVRSYSHYSNQSTPSHVETIYVDDGPDAVDFKIIQIANREDIVITQDYGLASLLIDKVYTVIHHNGMIYNKDNINGLLQQRFQNAQVRHQGGRHKGPPPFQEKDKIKFETTLQSILSQL